jgi:class 3 adenylate cyclase/CHASE2 domain-containing sensor protein
MKASVKKTAKKLAAPFMALIVFAAITLLNAAGVFRFLEYKTYDLRVRLLSPFCRPSDDIVLILLDQDSIDWAQEERGWAWPWPRQAHAELLHYMNAAGAKSVIFDVIFSEPSFYRSANQDAVIDTALKYMDEGRRNMEEARDAGTRRTSAGTGFMAEYRDAMRALRNLSVREDDNSFIEAERAYGRAVQTVFFSSQSGNMHEWPPDLKKPLFSLSNFDSILDFYSLEKSRNMSGGKAGDAPGVGAQFPIAGLRDEAGSLGSITSSIDSDGIIRRSRLFTLFDGKAVPGLSAAALLAAGGDNAAVYNKKKRLIEWADYTIPVDSEGRSILRFRGKLDRYFPYNAKSVLRNAESSRAGTELPDAGERLYPQDFKDKYVFFGYYAPGLFDICSTPIESVYPGMGIHITMLDNLLTGDFIRESPPFINVIMILVPVLLVTVITYFSRKILISLGAMILVMAGIIALGFGAYQQAGLWLQVIAPLMAAAGSFLAITLYNYATEGSQKRFIKSAFSQYLSPAVIEQIIADPSRLQLGGEKREMTAIFTDIRSFSTISEALGDPKKLVELLNYYLTAMSSIILENQGTIDKYEGDAIIAFFGAPVHMANHAALACRSAVQMKKTEEELNRQAAGLGLITPEVLEALQNKGIIKTINDPSLFTRLGVNTGDMVVGNMGTPNKMDYTIMGNAVNLAARLEGVNKQYNTGGILISEYTRGKIGDDFVIRSLDRVRVVGINTPLRLYELLNIRSEASPETLAMVQSWQEAVNAYEKKDFARALGVFKNISDKDSRDGTAKLYMERCNRYLSSPPPEEWDAVNNLTEK